MDERNSYQIQCCTQRIHRGALYNPFWLDEEHICELVRMWFTEKVHYTGNHETQVSRYLYISNDLH